MKEKERKELKEPKERLQYVRKLLNMSQQDFGVALDMNWHQIKDRELGKVRINSMFANHLANRLNINPDWLLYGHGDIFLKDIDIPEQFAERLKKDLKAADEQTINKIKFLDKIRYFFDKKTLLTRKEVISLAQILKQPLDEYLTLTGYITNSLQEITKNQKLNVLFRKISELDENDLDNIIDVINTVVDAYVSKHKKN